MADKPLDKWEKFDISTKAIAGILLPVMLLLVGNWYTSQQQRANDARLEHEKEAELAQRNADRVSSFLNHLASNNPKERKLSLEVLAYLANNNQMPDELLIPLISTVNDEDTEVAAAGSAALNQAAASDPEKAKSIVNAATSDPEKAKSIVKAAAGPNTNTETLIVKAAKFDPAFKSSINSAIESLKNDPKAAQSSLRIKAQFAKQ